MDQAHWTLFAIGSLLITVFSWWLSLQYKRYHGIPRFFAFECILLMVLLHSPLWFKDPVSPRQIASWTALGASLGLALYGYQLLRSLGKPGANFEDTSKLVVTGVYRYIRHPLYASLFWFALGAYLKDPGFLDSILLSVTAVCLFMTALVEEAEMTAKFGDEYRNYMKKSRRFIPFLF